MCMVEMAISNIQREITLKTGNKSYGSCVLHVTSWCLTFLSCFMKICQVVLKLWSGHKKLLIHTHTHTHTEKTKTIYPIALHTSYARGISRVTVHKSCMSSHGLTFV